MAFLLVSDIVSITFAVCVCSTAAAWLQRGRKCEYQVSQGAACQGWVSHPPLKTHSGQPGISLQIAEGLTSKDILA